MVGERAAPDGVAVAAEAVDPPTYCLCVYIYMPAGPTHLRANQLRTQQAEVEQKETGRGWEHIKACGRECRIKVNLQTARQSRIRHTLCYAPALVAQNAIAMFETGRSVHVGFDGRRCDG